ncbi:MAG: hypothetical protein K2X82_27100 [Gemmataceae bacterium]|nr:hypothetical protein [Gemmataceae bacterium]
MTEAEWFGQDSEGYNRLMFALGPRRSRLLAAACCRAAAHAAGGPVDEVVAAAAAVEQFADTGKSKAALRRARQAVRAVRNREQDRPIEFARSRLLFRLLWAAEVAATENIPHRAVEELIVAQAEAWKSWPHNSGSFFHLYTDIAGPVVPAAFDPGWRTPSAVALARTMYEGRDFAHMPILADALEDAGCADEAVIGHCRDPHGVHVRGCWVVDLVLGKA